MSEQDKFKPTTDITQQKIRARWGENWRLDDFKYVHRVKAAEWTGTEMEHNLNPGTLYAKKYFEKYRRQRPPQPLVANKGNIDTGEAWMEAHRKQEEAECRAKQIEHDSKTS